MDKHVDTMADDVLTMYQGKENGLINNPKNKMRPSSIRTLVDEANPGKLVEEHITAASSNSNTLTTTFTSKYPSRRHTSCSCSVQTLCSHAIKISSESTLNIG